VSGQVLPQSYRRAIRDVVEGLERDLQFSDRPDEADVNEAVERLSEIILSLWSALQESVARPTPYPNSEGQAVFWHAHAGSASAIIVPVSECLGCRLETVLSSARSAER
jgi:hypothetical protein